MGRAEKLKDPARRFSDKSSVELTFEPSLIAANKSFMAVTSDRLRV
jgi:hypothetical protein